MCLYQHAFNEKQLNDVSINNLILTRPNFEPQAHKQIQQSWEVPRGHRVSSWWSCWLGQGLSLWDFTFLRRRNMITKNVVCSFMLWWYHIRSKKHKHTHLGWFYTFKLPLEYAPLPPQLEKLVDLDPKPGAIRSCFGRPRCSQSWLGTQPARCVDGMLPTTFQKRRASQWWE